MYPRILLIALVLTAPAFGQSTQPTTLFAELPVFHSAAEILKAVPEKLYPRQMSEWTDVRLDAVNEQLQKLIGREAEVEITVMVVKTNPTFGRPDDPYKYEIGAEVTKLGETPVWIWCFFREDQKAALASVNKGEKLKVSGKIWHIRLHRDRDNAKSVPFDLNLSDCTVKAA